MSAIRELDAGEFAHQAFFYRDDVGYLSHIVSFVQDGLSAGEPVAVAVPAPALVHIRTALGSAARVVRFIDMNDAGRNPGGIIPSVLLAFADSHSGRVRIIGEPIWPGRSAAEYPACVRHEALINAAFAGRSATILCPYDVAGLDPSVVDDAQATHPVLVDDTGRRRSPGYAPDHAVDRYNLPLRAPADSASMAFDLGSLAKARHFAVDCALDLGLASARLDDLALAVGEACGNSIEHGGGSGMLRVWRQDGDVVCEVADAGYLADPLAGLRPAPVYQSGGRGLLLINQVADLVRFHITPQGTILHIHLRG